MRQYRHIKTGSIYNYLGNQLFNVTPRMKDKAACFLSTYADKYGYGGLEIIWTEQYECRDIVFRIPCILKISIELDEYFEEFTIYQSVDNAVIYARPTRDFNEKFEEII